MRTLAVPVCFNEEHKIGRVVDRFSVDIPCDLMVMDDGSTDNSAAEVRARGVSVLSHPERRGVGAAIRTAIKHAVKEEYDVIVILAGNDKDRPAEIPILLAPIEKEGAHLVQGSRYLKKGEYGEMPYYRKLATRLHPLLFSAFAGQRFTDTTNGFRAVHLSIFKHPKMNIDQDWLNRYELEPYLLFQTVKLGFRVCEVPVTKIYPPKKQGYTKMKPFTGWWSILRPIFLLGWGIKH